MIRTLPETLCRYLPRFDFAFFLVGTTVLLPFLASNSTLDPTLTPRFVLLGGILLALALSFGLQSALGSQAIDCDVLHHFIFLLFLGHLLFCLLSLLRAINLGEGVYGTAKVFMSVVFLSVSSILLNRKSTYISRTAQVIVLSTIVLCSIGFYQYFTEGASHVSGHFMVRGTMGHKNLFASALFLMLPFCLYVILRFRGWWHMTGTCAAASILVLVLLSQTRTVWLALFASGALTAVVYLLAYRRDGTRLPVDVQEDFLRGICRVMVIFLVLGVLVAMFYLRSHSVEDFTRAAFSTESISQRLWVWKKTLAIIRDNLLWGVGMGNWKITLPSYGVPAGFSPEWSKTNFFVRPHNDFLWVLSETGLIGFCFYVSIYGVLYFYILRLLGRRVPNDDRVLSLLMFYGITGYLVISLFSFPRERVVHSVFLSLMMSIVVVVYHRYQIPDKPRRRLRVGGFVVLSSLLLPVVVALGCVRLNAEIHVKRALAARGAGDYRKAVSEIDRAYSSLCTLDPTSTPLKWYRGEAYFLSDRFAEAIEDYERALAANPYHIHVLNNLATCYQIRGKRDQAIDCYERLLHIFPGFAEAACNLAAVYFNAAEYERARDTLARCDPTLQSPLIERYRRIVAEKIEERRISSMSPRVKPQDLAAYEPARRAAEGRLGPLHRLWSATRGRYFYTIDTRERDAFLDRRDETWIYEGIDQYVFATNCTAGLSPVHRFYSPKLGAYFYTIQPTEIRKLSDDNDRQWQHQGVVFFAFPAAWQPPGSSPVYRFWSGRLQHHYFTINQNEKNKFQAKYSDTWVLEGVAWYAYR